MKREAKVRDCTYCFKAGIFTRIISSIARGSYINAFDDIEDKIDDELYFRVRLKTTL